MIFTASYYLTRDRLVDADSLQHHGVLGMKWGVRKAQYKASKNERLRKKALNYDAKSAKMTKKSEQAHAKNDLERSNRKATKAANYDKKAATLSKKALKTDSELKRSVYESRSAKASYKATKAKLAADRLSKSAGYGAKAMKYSVKSDKAALMAAKARKRIASNERYITSMKRKVNDISPEERKTTYAFVNDWLKEQ